MKFIKGAQWRQGGCDTIRLTMKRGSYVELKVIAYERTIDGRKEMILCEMEYENYDAADKAYRRIVESFDQIYDEFGNELEEDYE